jgi:phosphotriesterase-related protein
VLISQDSGWYRVGEPGGGQFNGYTYIFDEFLPLLKKRGLSEQQLRTLTITNPAKVLTPMPV